VETARIAATVDVVVDDRPALTVIGEMSHMADITFLGLPQPRADDLDRLERTLDTMMSATAGLPAVAFVLASEEASLEGILR
jgi:hypothetical protein